MMVTSNGNDIHVHVHVPVMTPKHKYAHLIFDWTSSRPS